jgi:hypothetical protein
MLLNLLKRVVKATLHQATDEWLLETGLPKEMIDELRLQRQERADLVVAQVDALAARRLDVEDEQEALSTLPALPISSAMQLTQASDGECDLMDQVHQQRQANVGWAEITQGAARKGFQISEDALRTRYRRWRKKNGLMEEPDQAG